MSHHSVNQLGREREISVIYEKSITLSPRKNRIARKKKTDKAIKTVTQGKYPSIRKSVWWS